MSIQYSKFGQCTPTVTVNPIQIFSGGPTNTITSTVPLTSGNAVIVVLFRATGVGGPSLITDNLGNVWSVIRMTGSPPYMVFYSCFNVLPGSSTITSSAVEEHLIAIEFSGVTAIDTATQTSGVSMTPNTGSIPVSGNNRICVGGYVITPPPATQVTDAPATQAYSTLVVTAGQLGYQLNTSAATTLSFTTTGGAGTWQSIGVSLKP